mmetsp:Transcript_18426/g.47219  ORF Transcript_18426/g.47219 Transcript_18426/m.47219 type:complete len:298 (-) Transcript_18426:190-1083(-)
MLHRADKHRLRTRGLGDGTELQREHGRIRLHRRRLVQRHQPQVVRLAVGAWDLDKRVDVADSRDVVGDEGSHLGLELDVVGFVARDVLEEFLDLRAHRKACVLLRVVETLGHRPRAIAVTITSAIVIIFVIVGRRRGRRHRAKGGPFGAALPLLGLRGRLLGRLLRRRRAAARGATHPHRRPHLLAHRRRGVGGGGGRAVVVIWIIVMIIDRTLARKLHLLVVRLVGDGRVRARPARGVAPACATSALVPPSGVCRRGLMGVIVGRAELHLLVICLVLNHLRIAPDTPWRGLYAALD